ncbi:hypothetical protein NCCP2145_05910 [Pseudarthrobacter sp. NCCP-2145]|nr:hypothetical protein NCCP2145_05910 [Pseudarthrobacter sp. NCCP-2145]
MVMFAKPGFDLLVDLRHLIMQIQDGAGESGDHPSADVLGLNGDALRLSSCDGLGGDCLCVVAALVPQPRCDTRFACPADAGVVYFVNSTTAALTMA